MADNTPITAGSGTDIATDEIGGVHYQRSKAVWGANGTANDASDAAPLPTAPGASATVAAASVHRASGVTTSIQTVKGSAGNLYAIYVEHNNTVSVWIQIFDNSGTPTLGSTTPTMSFSVPPGDGASVYGKLENPITVPVGFANAIKYAVTTTSSGNTAPSTGAIVHAIYK